MAEQHDDSRELRDFMFETRGKLDHLIEKQKDVSVWFTPRPGVDTLPERVSNLETVAVEISARQKHIEDRLTNFDSTDLSGRWSFKQTLVAALVGLIGALITAFIKG